jgi:transposase
LPAQILPEPGRSDAPEPAFVPLSILPEPMDHAVSSTAEAAQDCIGVMTIEVGPDLRLRVPGDVAVERAAALVRALRGAA